MYQLQQRVWVKDRKQLGWISERGWMPLFKDGELVGRRAFYVVALNSHDYMTGSDNLRAADWCCDGCGRWLAGVAHATTPDGLCYDRVPDSLLHFCFLCSAPQVVGYGY